MGPNQTKSISMGPIWNTSGTETVFSVPVSSWVQNGLGPKWAVFGYLTRTRESNVSLIKDLLCAWKVLGRHYLKSGIFSMKLLKKKSANLLSKTGHF